MGYHILYDYLENENHYWRTGYVIIEKEKIEIGWWWTIKLLMLFKTGFFLVFCLCIQITILLGFYLIFHSYLIYSGTTTNEKIKQSHIYTKIKAEIKFFATWKNSASSYIPTEASLTKYNCTAEMSRDEIKERYVNAHRIEDDFFAWSIWAPSGLLAGYHEALFPESALDARLAA